MEYRFDLIHVSEQGYKTWMISLMYNTATVESSDHYPKLCDEVISIPHSTSSSAVVVVCVGKVHL